MFDDAALVAFRMVPRRIQELLDDDLERLLGQYVFCPRQEGAAEGAALRGPATAMFRREAQQRAAPR